MAQDMMSRMLENLVDHVFAKVGYTREQIKEKVEGVLTMGSDTVNALKQLDARLARVEANQLLVIEAENGRRAERGEPALGAIHNGSSPDGTTLRRINGNGG